MNNFSIDTKSTTTVATLLMTTTVDMVAKKISFLCSAVVLLIISGCILASIISYHLKNASQLTRNPPRLRRQRSSLSNLRYELKDKQLDKLNLLVALTVAIRCLHETIHAFIQPSSDFYCTFYLRTHIILYGLAIAAVYIFLWMRQRNIYGHRIIRYDLPCANILSKMVIFLMIISVTGTVVIFFITRNYRLENGCCVVQPIFEVYSFVPWVVLATLSIMFQLILMVMFVYPLINHKRIMHSQACRPTDDYNLMIKRIAVAAGICVASDIFAVFVTFFTNVRISNFIYDVNLVVDLICVSCSFADWRKRLFFSCCLQTDPSNSNNNTDGGENCVSNSAIKRGEDLALGLR